MKKIYLFAATLCAAVTAMYAQNTLRPGIYYHNMHYYNAAAGLDDTAAKASVDIYARNKFVQDENKDTWEKPLNLYLNHIYNLDQKNSFNVSYLYDGYSFYKRNIIYLGYSRTLCWGRDNRLSLGIRPVLNFNSINPDQLGLGPVLDTRFRFNADLDLGAQYQWKGLTAGVGYKNLFASSVKEDGLDLIKDQRELYVNLSYDFRLFKRKVGLAPFLLFYSERNMNLDAGLNLSFKDRIQVSYALRILELRSIYTVRARIDKRFQVGLALDHSSLYTDVNMDVLLGYRF
ncbi:type IX secretion system membrane protein PorP/SprF [Edaphocola aurantiacus]|uniref:type IX secretion system membrane protein PorP/SprF n=1 Tax=Edaphocola aurantiacus TaxID=2601682 RepID=UPI001C974D51|nr:type IX secretion system membrane protein PorP/SprF [Edaphocola aurantiacus]